MKAGGNMTEPYLATFEDVWNNSLLVFDTNSLLRIYEWNIDKAIEFKDVLNFKIESIWIPHQVNLEFTKHVEHAEAFNKYTDIIVRLENQPIKWGKIRKAFKRWESNGYEEDFKQKVMELEIRGVRPEKLLELKQFTDKLHSEHRRIIPINSIFKELFSNVGEPFLNSEEQKLLKEFDETPLAPGYMDREKRNANAHGDFFVWKQIQRKSIKSSRDIIFITLDLKEDWFSDKKEQLPREGLLKEFYEITQNRIIIISLTSFLEQCSVYLNEDIRELVAYSSIQDEVREFFDQWFPDQLLDKINKYLAEDDTIKDEMESVLEVCIDTVSFEGVTEHQFNLDDHEIIENDDSYIVFHTHIDLTADFDANAHCANEDFELGTASVELRVWINITVEKEWQSEDSDRVAFKREAESVDIIDIEFLGASGDFDDQDFDEYDEYDDYDDEYDEDMVYEYEDDEN
ncbi:MAG: PIN-like domain-containing protein [Paenibacillus sp.]|uniref:PIN-like domain-containing protein n=1 Tax=Paenibacillus sp. TaxID=58172 RepID=UPI00290E90F4|nr:PIN-like domain-containing protein [Paenibacillus sp.]MDU4694724.1 PIN-like domain-containing protein [Paenibacillus sp.]